MQIPPLLMAAAAVSELQHPGLATGGLFWQDLHAQVVNIPNLMEYLDSVQRGVQLRSNEEFDAMHNAIAPVGAAACVVPTLLYLIVRSNVSRSVEAVTQLLGSVLGFGGARLAASTTFNKVRPLLLLHGI